MSFLRKVISEMVLKKKIKKSGFAKIDPIKKLETIKGKSK